MSIVIWLLTAFLVLDCLLLILLVLIQLPKKEAGMGQAFGAGTTDALFGAGSGNVLTKLTKYSTGIFLACTLLISVLQSSAARSKSGDPRLKLSKEELAEAMPKPPAPTNAAPAAVTTPATPTNTLTFTNLNLLNATNAVKATNASPAAPAAAAPSPPK